MKIRITWLLLSLLLPLFVHAHLQISSRVTEADSGDPLPYVNIGISGLNLGTVSDFEGNFALENVPADSLVRFSALGYLDQSIKASRLIELQVIELAARDYDIEEIEIIASRFDPTERIFGVRNEKKRGLSLASQEMY